MNAKFAVLLSAMTVMTSIPAIAQETAVAIRTAAPNQEIQPATVLKETNLKGKLQPVEISIAPVQEKQKQEPDRLRHVADSVKVNPDVASGQPDQVTLIKVSF